MTIYGSFGLTILTTMNQYKQHIRTRFHGSGYAPSHNKENFRFNNTETVSPQATMPIARRRSSTRACHS